MAAFPLGSLRALRTEVGIGDSCGNMLWSAYLGFGCRMPSRALVIIGWRGGAARCCSGCRDVGAACGVGVSCAASDVELGAGSSVGTGGEPGVRECESCVAVDGDVAVVGADAELGACTGEDGEAQEAWLIGWEYALRHWAVVCAWVLLEKGAPWEPGRQREARRRSRRRPWKTSVARAEGAPWRERGREIDPRRRRRGATYTYTHDMRRCRSTCNRGDQEDSR